MNTHPLYSKRCHKTINNFRVDVDTGLPIYRSDGQTLLTMLLVVGANFTNNLISIAFF